MVSNQNKSPYHGQLAVVLALILPPILLTAMFYGVITMWQPRFGVELNWISAKFLGCGVGVLFHLCCLIMGAFEEHFAVVRNRLKEFFSDLSISTSLAFEWYFKDIKENGIAFWIDLAAITANFAIFLDALIKFVKLKGWFF